MDEVAQLALSASSAQHLRDAVMAKAVESSNPDDLTVLAIRRRLDRLNDPSCSLTKGSLVRTA
ncbi:hypothetical protein NicSoilC12_36540 [Arthrobacter sp. NicSoilC12]|nr:hypothetical protein NicSoilC12_36540 [Arthrobacter sp. NicSoilC12]